MEARWIRWVLGIVVSGSVVHADSVVRVGTYNVENYLLAATETRSAKSEAAKAKVAESLKALAADVVGLQEVGGRAAVEDLRTRVARLGWSYPYSEHLPGPDTNIQVALLSRFPVARVVGHTNDAFLLAGRRFRVSRGFLEADIAVGGGVRVTVFVAHLKSRRTSTKADEADLRREEARLLRARVDGRLRADPGACVVVLGDLNDTRDSEPVRLLLGRGRDALVDTRPGERNGDTGFRPFARAVPRTVAWTHHYGAEDTYSRVDYVLLNRVAAAVWVPGESAVLAMPDWGVASDHRPVSVVLRMAGGGVAGP